MSNVVDNLPVRSNSDPNSIKATRRASYQVGGKRMEILTSIYSKPDFWSCERFDVRKDWLHQSTSANLNALWRAGMLERDVLHVRKTYSGSDEYIYELPVWLRSQWDGRPQSLDDVLARNMERIKTS
jgi:hypothetical protein